MDLNEIRITAEVAEQKRPRDRDRPFLGLGALTSARWHARILLTVVRLHALADLVDFVHQQPSGFLVDRDMRSCRG